MTIKEFNFSKTNSFYINGESVDSLNKIKRNIGENIKVYTEGLMGLDKYNGKIAGVKKESPSIYKIKISCKERRSGE